MGRPAHFEIPVDDPDRAEKFYAAVFDWKIERFEGAPQYYGLANTGDGEPGINGALFARSADNSGTSITMETGSIEDSVAKVTAAGGTVVENKMPIPGIGWFAVCKDTEGNRFGVFKNDPSATM